MADEFKVKLDGFEGPLDLLLALIEKRKLPINDVSLAAVADDYIEYLKDKQEFPLSQTSHFVLVASTLLLIKSKSLLPTLSLTDTEEEDIKILEERLMLYKRIKALSAHVSGRFGARVLFEAEESKNVEPLFSPAHDVSIRSMQETIKRVIANLPITEFLPEAVVKKIMSIEEAIENLTSRITQSLRMNFGEFANAKKNEKIEVIVSFLAMLELVKQGIINATQEKTFEDITMEADTLGVPKYE
ncbi:segregation/condensation protein A [Candidatus Kaiserbacteria bacterium]|nr:segregation/condensation protein A [Candidatus Kaiserbacteria bacterium]